MCRDPVLLGQGTRLVRIRGRPNVCSVESTLCFGWGLVGRDPTGTGNDLS